MTAKNSAYKLSSAVFQHIRELRTITIIMAILYIIVGPVTMVMNLRNQANSAGDLSLTEYAVLVASYFRDSYFTGYYFIAFFIGIALGLYITRYQNHRKESDFYHSLPVQRRDLLTSRVLAVVIIQAVLLAVVFIAPTVAMLVMPSMHAQEFGGLIGLTIAWSLTSFVNVLLFFLLALATTLFAGQLTGSTFAQVAMLFIFHVTLPAIGLITQFLLSSCYSTYASGGVTQVLQSCNVFSGLLAAYGGASHTQLSQFGLRELMLNLSTYAVWMVLIVVCLALTYWLYSRRPAEKAGDTLIYRWVGTLIKMIYIILGGFTLGGIFGNVTFVGFIIGVLAAGILVHMIAEMIYNQDIFGVKKHLLSGIVATAIGLALSCGIYFNVIDYDHYLPKESSVQAVVVGNIPAEGMYSVQALNTLAYSTDRDYIAQVMEMAEQASEANTNYRSQNSDVSYGIGIDGAYVEYYETSLMQNVVDVNIGYRTVGGLTTERRYTLTVEDAIAIFGELNNEAAYHEGLWNGLVNDTDDILNADMLQIYPAGLPDLTDDPVNITIWNNDSSINNNGLARAEELMTALKADIAVRDQTVVSSTRIATLDTGMSGYIIPIYEKDEATAALLEKWREEGFMEDRKEALTELTEDYDWALIQYDDSDYGYSIEYLLDDSEVIVDCLMNDITSIDQIIAGGVAYEDKYALAYFYKDEEVEDIRDNFSGSFYLIEGRIPAAG